MLWVTRDGLEGLGDSLKQQGIHDTRILQGERAERGREGKNDMAVGHLE
jgi:hypothetical protein